MFKRFMIVIVGLVGHLEKTGGRVEMDNVRMQTRPTCLRKPRITSADGAREEEERGDTEVSGFKATVARR